MGIFDELLAETQTERKPLIFDPEQTRPLVEKLLEPPDRPFKPMDKVVWKPGFQAGNKFPTEDLPALVVRVLDPPLPALKESIGAPHYGAPLDLEIAVIDPSDGELMTYLVQSRRMRHFD